MAEQTEKPKPHIPAPPWTLEALGPEKYAELALEYGVLDVRIEQKSYRPSLDLTDAYEAQEVAAAKKAKQPAKPAEDKPAQ